MNIIGYKYLNFKRLILKQLFILFQFVLFFVKKLAFLLINDMLFLTKDFYVYRKDQV